MTAWEEHVELERVARQLVDNANDCGLPDAVVVSIVHIADLIRAVRALERRRLIEGE